jgi:acetate kinase
MSCFDTSMGLTPLEGLPMGTRCGDVDPGLGEYLNQQCDMSQDDIMSLYNKQSGLLGISGISNDMRTLRQHAQKGDRRARLAIELFAYKVARYIGALATNLERIDALVFTGGIGENDALARSLILKQLSILGFKIDRDRNEQHGGDSGRITGNDSTLAMVVATDEEMMIAQDAQRIILQMKDGGA